MRNMPSPRGTNFEQLYITTPGFGAAYDARRGLGGFDGLTPEEYGRRAYRRLTGRLAYDDTNPSAGQAQAAETDADADPDNIAAWIKHNLSYEAIQNLVMALQGTADDDGTGLGEEADRDGSKFPGPSYSEGQNMPPPEGSSPNVFGGARAGAGMAGGEITPGWQPDRTISMKDFPSWNNAPKITPDSNKRFRGRRTGGAQDDPPDFRGRPRTGGTMSAMDGGTSPFYGSMDTAPPRRAREMSAAQKQQLDTMVPGLSRIKII
jgi:hypothetical protein